MNLKEKKKKAGIHFIDVFLQKIIVFLSKKKNKM